MIAKILKAQRKERGLTQQEAAKIFHVTRQTISNWENEKNYPDIPTLVAISDYYEVSLDYLMKGDVKYMAKIKQEAKLLQSFQVGLFSVICAVALLLFSFAGFVAAINGGSLAGIIPIQLSLTIAMGWVCVIHFKNLKDVMTPSVKNTVSMFLLVTLFLIILCTTLLILAALGYIHF